MVAGVWSVVVQFNALTIFLQHTLDTQFYTWISVIGFFRSITFRNICMTQQCGRFWKSAFTFATNIGLDPCLLAFRILLCRYSISPLAYTSVILEGRLLLRSWKMHKFASTASNCLLFSVGIPEIENLVLLYSARVWIRLLYGDVCIRMGFYMSKISTFHI